MRTSRFFALLFGIAVVVALCGLRANDPYVVNQVRQLGFDQLQRLKPRENGDQPVRVVAIDEQSLKAYGQWPWPRDLLWSGLFQLLANAQRFVEIVGCVMVFGLSEQIIDVRHGRKFNAPRAAVTESCAAVYRYPAGIS